MTRTAEIIAPIIAEAVERRAILSILLIENPLPRRGAWIKTPKQVAESAAFHALREHAAALAVADVEVLAGEIGERGGMLDLWHAVSALSRSAASENVLYVVEDLRNSPASATYWGVRYTLLRSLPRDICEALGWTVEGDDA
jgi:hypothetical protein